MEIFRLDTSNMTHCSYPGYTIYESHSSGPGLLTLLYMRMNPLSFVLEQTPRVSFPVSVPVAPLT